MPGTPAYEAQVAHQRKCSTGRRKRDRASRRRVTSQEMRTSVASWWEAPLKMIARMEASWARGAHTAAIAFPELKGWPNKPWHHSTSSSPRLAITY